jgi:uncharacterized protein (TIGR02246 family)
MMDAVTDDEAAIRGLVAAWSRALEAKDVDGLLAHYAPDAVIYDCVASAVRMGPDGLRRSWESCLPFFPANFRSEHRDLVVEVGGDIAFLYGLHHLVPAEAGHPVGATWMRVSACYRRVGGQWLAVHEHVSLPFDPISGKVVSIADPDAALPPIGACGAKAE